MLLSETFIDCIILYITFYLNMLGSSLDQALPFLPVPFTEFVCYFVFGIVHIFGNTNLGKLYNALYIHFIDSRVTVNIVSCKSLQYLQK